MRPDADQSDNHADRLGSQYGLDLGGSGGGMPIVGMLLQSLQLLLL